MATQTYSANFQEVRQAGASKGVSLSTTAAFTAIPLGTQYLSLLPNTFTTAVVARFLLNPWLTVFKTTDLLATMGNLTDYSTAAQDSTTTTVLTLNSFDTIANTNALLIGSHIPFGGASIDVQNTNGTASVLTVKYWNGAWTDITATDNTASAGATLAQDGTVTWTMPTDWTTGALATIQGGTPPNQGVFNEALYWTRWEVSAALDSSVTLNSLLPISRSTAYAELPTGVAWNQGVKVGPGGVSTIQALTDAGTALLLVNCAVDGRFGT